MKSGEQHKTIQRSADLVLELDSLEKLIVSLKVEYEQYFSGAVTLAPEKLHADVRRNIRFLLKAPFKNSAMSYRLKGLERRYHTLNTYWQRVLKQREEGTYHKDVFRANLRERVRQEDENSKTQKGAAERGMHALFDSYKGALEKETGKKQNLDFDSFKKTLLARAKDFKDKHPGKKVSFKVVVRDGKVNLRAETR